MNFPEIDITINDDAVDVVKRMGNDAGLGQAIARSMDKQNELALGQINLNRLSGPTSDGTLSVRSGHLRRSTRRGDENYYQRAAQWEGGGVITSAIGSNVVYAGVHEFGFTGTVQVPGHSRKRITTQSFKFGGKTVRRRVRGGDIFVRPHAMRLNIKARAPFSKGLADYADTYGREVSSAILDYAAGQGGKS